MSFSLLFQRFYDHSNFVFIFFIKNRECLQTVENNWTIKKGCADLRNLLFPINTMTTHQNEFNRLWRFLNFLKTLFRRLGLGWSLICTAEHLRYICTQSTSSLHILETRKCMQIKNWKKNNCGIVNWRSSRTDSRDSFSNRITLEWCSTNSRTCWVIV